MTHKHKDFKLTTVRYYLDNDTTYDETNDRRVIYYSTLL